MPHHPASLLERLDNRDGDRPLEAGRPIFLQNLVYGTRCSTGVAVDPAGRGRIWERRFDNTGAVTGETEIGF